jgi:hypothetical protein
MRRVLLLVIVLSGLAETIQAATAILIGASTIGPYQLGHTQIISASEKIVYQGRTLIRETDYQIDYGDGYVVFSQPILIGDTIFVQFDVLPLNIKTSYSIMKPVPAGVQETTIYNPTVVRPIGSTEGLELFGSQRFVVNIGNRGEPSMSQSLDLSISGKLAPGVDVKGSVSDRNFDNVSGGTASLDELDKVLLQLNAPGFKADFGDLDLIGIDNSLLAYTRKLNGIEVQGQTGDFSGSSALAFSPGKQIELFFFGVDGRQGPYFFQSQDASHSLDLLANGFLSGTEEIYLDGKRLTRGGENDYNIDYFEGYIEFTPKNVISSRNRITVKIQQANESYRRTFYYGKAFIDKGLKVGIQFLREGDDKSRPRSFDIGEAQSKLLSEVGANADSAFLSGAKYIGPNKGDYNLQIDSSGDSVYVFAGPDSGSYQVSFSRLEQGRGSYQYAGAGKYVYVGQGNGVYLPVIYYPLPQSQNYGSVLFKREGDIFANGELAFSQDDRNTFSSKDERLTGFGFNGSLGWHQKDFGLLRKTWSGNLLEFRLRNLDRDFRYPGIIDPVEYVRQYNLPSIAGQNTGRLIEGHSSAITAAGDYFDFGAGAIKSDTFESRRSFGKIGLVAFDRLMLSANADIARTQLTVDKTPGWWNKYETGGRIIRGRFQPMIAVRHELKTSVEQSVDGFKADEYESGLQWFVTGIITSNSKVVYRNQQYNRQAAVGWHRQFQQYQLEQTLAAGNTKAGFSGETNLGRLFQKSQYPQDEKLSRNIGSLKLNFNSALTSVTFYENINGTARVLKAREYIFVGKGKGDYRRDGSDYVPEQGGEYIEVIRQLGDQPAAGGVSGYQVTGGLRARYDGGALAKGIMKHLIYENDLTYQMNTQAGVNISVGRLLPMGRFDVSKLGYRNHDFKQRIKYRFGNRGNYLSHTLNSSQTLGNQYQFENLESRSLANAFELKMSTGTRASYLTAVELGSDKSSLYSGNVNIDRVKIGFTPEFQIGEILRLANLIEYLSEKEKIRNIVVSTYSLSPKLVFNIRNIGRIESEIDYSRVQVGKMDILLPYVLAEGKKPGDNYNLLLNGRLKVNQFSSLVISYNYKKLGDGYSNYNFRIEAKAEF